MKIDFLLATIALTMAAAVWAEDQPAVPHHGEFRSWQHVKSIVIGADHTSFARRGGIHHYYANEKAMEGYRTGKFPNGSVIVDEGVYGKDGEGQAKGILLEGERRGLDVMVKDDRVYKETGGWGFEHFDGSGKIGGLAASGRAQCYGCHSKQKERDHVFSAVRK